MNDKKEDRGEVVQVVKKRLAHLMSVKSLVTLVLTGIFAYLACAGEISQEFMMVYTVIIGFYFGTQSQKLQEVLVREVDNGDQ